MTYNPLNKHRARSRSLVIRISCSRSYTTYATQHSRSQLGLIRSLKCCPHRATKMTFTLLQTKIKSSNLSKENALWKLHRASKILSNKIWRFHQTSRYLYLGQMVRNRFKSQRKHLIMNALETKNFSLFSQNILLKVNNLVNARLLLPWWEISVLVRN